MNTDKRLVIKSYLTQYHNPIILKTGDIVTLGKEESKVEWKGWVWAETTDNSGWIPKQIVETHDNKNGIIKENYTAKELDIKEGCIVSVIKVLNGWLWVRNESSDEEGWIPEENTSVV